MEQYSEYANCKYCGRKFKKNSKAHVYCSGRCKEAYRLSKLELHEGKCLGCGAPITFKITGNRQTKYYCSTACQLKHTVPDKLCRCIDCGVEFMFHGRTTKLRCDSCNKKFLSRKTMIARALKDPTVQIGAGSGGAQNLMLGEEAAADRTAQNARRRAYYAKNAERMRATARAKYRTILCGDDSCAVCGYNKFQEALVVHHIDMDRANNSPDNLAILCSNCHVYLHKRIRKIQKKESKSTVDIYNELRQAEVKSRNEAGTSLGKGQSEPKADSNDSQGQRVAAGPEKDISSQEAVTTSDS